jgi:MarR family transcriptional regulator, organic hydroperoxide resistance regulator
MDRIEACISFLLSKAYQQVNQDARQRLAPYGVTPVQYALLKLLWQHEGQSGVALGDRLRLDSATVNGLLDRLGRAGLIERRPDPHDRRANLIYLTDLGRSLEVPLDREMDALNADLLGQFDAVDAERLRALLARIGRVPEVAPEGGAYDR